MVLMAHHFMIVSRPGFALAYSLVPLRLDWTGVDLFFVLSDFLIGGILLDASGSSNYFLCHSNLGSRCSASSLTNQT
jgi:peptidoglycan/LPS O-acetylase OafA/YrhL